MSKERLLKNIDDAIIHYHIDQLRSQEENSEDLTEDYPSQLEKYARKAKQIRFKAKAAMKKQRNTRIISIADASSRLKDWGSEKNVFPIFKKHVEHHGLAANYRNFDKMSEEEMRNILEQIDLTALFDDIEESLDNE